jgi:hypothetical protein
VQQLRDAHRRGAQRRRRPRRARRRHQPLRPADVYGGTRSEQYLGRALAGRRDEVVIATKFVAPIDDDPSHAGAGARWVAEAVEGSLRRLGTDRIDLYQQHGPDPNVPIEETLTALDRLVRDGKVREIGNSNFSGEQIDEAESVSERQGLARFVSAQNHFNLLHREPLQDVVPACVRAFCRTSRSRADSSPANTDGGCPRPRAHGSHSFPRNAPPVSCRTGTSTRSTS